LFKSRGNDAYDNTQKSIRGKEVGAEKLLQADEKTLKKMPKYKLQKQLKYDQ
jgi:hypothetical protein